MWVFWYVFVKNRDVATDCVFVFELSARYSKYTDFHSNECCVLSEIHKLLLQILIAASITFIALPNILNLRKALQINRRWIKSATMLQFNKDYFINYGTFFSLFGVDI